ncbi:hypothetical protein T12_16220 [Trichinella patagoniensis]|uniref:Uncharacterized protein n=1 Tax=Trichinella patagoniensis TaxID=990121 RepID=A0A0V0Z055_9BILA|nr:hypothetical protein T12_16220 [Trichinella patagoniensis]
MSVATTVFSIGYSFRKNCMYLCNIFRLLAMHSSSTEGNIKHYALYSLS